MSAPESMHGLSRPRISIYILVIIVSLSILLIHSAKAQDDMEPPAPPSGLRIVDNMLNIIIATDITIAWDANTESDLAGYNVYHRVNSETDFSQIASTSGESTSITVTGLTPGINSLAVTAFDTSNNESGFSNVVSVVIALVCGDGMVSPEEECDDGNLEDGDGCSSACLVEEPTPTVTAIPTLSEWGLIAMAGVLGIIGFMVIRRRKVTA